MAVLSDRTLREQIAAGRIVLEPLDESCIQPASIDVHLDRFFRVFRNHTMAVIDVKQDLSDLTEAGRGRARTASSSSTPASSSSAPRSSSSACPTTSWPAWRARLGLGRLGLLIHSTAGFVDAGFDGHITLELSNVANLPITLYPGMKIGQISFLRDDDAGRAPVRLRRPRLEVPGPAGPHAQPLLGELHRPRVEGTALSWSRR